MKKSLRVVGVLGVIICFFGLCLVISANRGRNVDIEAMRKAGAITTIEDWNARLPKVGEDAFAPYKEVWSDVARLSAHQRTSILTTDLFVKLQNRSGAAGAQDAITIDSHLKAVLNDARRASEMPRYVLPYKPDGVDYRDAEGILFAGRLLGACAYTESKSGHMDEAFDDFRRIGKLLAQMRTDLNYSSRLNYSTVNGELLLLLEAVVREHSNDPSTLAKVIKVIDGLPPLRDLEDDLKSEALDSLYGIRQAEQDPNKYLDGTDFVDSRANKKITPWGRVHVHLLFNKAIHLQRVLYESMPKDHRDWRGVQQALFDADKRATDLAPLGAGARPYLSDEVAVGDWVQQIARRRMVLSCAKILLSRLDQRRLPGELLPFDQDAIDPFTNALFHYSVKGDSFEIASQPIGFNFSQGETYKFKNLEPLPIRAGGRK